MKKNNKGFTLVELLAVIVILAIILVIAVPKIMNTINDATKASLESSAKMVAAQVENQYTVAQTLNKPFGETGSCMEEWAGLNENDYASCKYEITNDGEAKVTLEGKNKFKNLWACNATRSSATAQEDICLVETAAECFDFEDGEITDYDITCGTDVVIPSKINGVDVVKIGSGAFRKKGITSVYLPNTIETIGYISFEDNNISTIEVPSSVTLTGRGAFNNNPLTNVKINNMDMEIGCGAFGDPNTIATHNLPDDYEYECAPG